MEVGAKRGPAQSVQKRSHKDAKYNNEHALVAHAARLLHQHILHIALYELAVMQTRRGCVGVVVACRIKHAGGPTAHVTNWDFTPCADVCNAAASVLHVCSAAVASLWPVLPF